MSDAHWEEIAQSLSSYPDPIGELMRRAITSADDRRGVLEAIVCGELVASRVVTVHGVDGWYERYDERASKHFEALLAGLSAADQLSVVGIVSVLEGALVGDEVVLSFLPPKWKPPRNKRRRR
jgi:hypothetical protein